MATVARGGGAASSRVTCYKCGQPGHWSRDCTAPPETWAPDWRERLAARAPAGASQQPGGAPGGPEGGDPAAPPQQQPAKAARQPRAKRPRLTVENHLLGAEQPYALPHVYNTFPGAFKKRFKGHGHEAGDLSRLIGMYETWHRQLFPASTFDAFVEKLESLGSTRLLRNGVGAMRAQHVHGFDMDAELRRLQDEEEEDAIDAAVASAEANAANLAEGLGEFDMGTRATFEEDDEDEFPEELMGGGLTGAGGNDDDDDDDADALEAMREQDDDMDAMHEAEAAAPPPPLPQAPGARELTDEQRAQIEARKAAALARVAALRAEREAAQAKEQVQAEEQPDAGEDNTVADDTGAA